MRVGRICEAQARGGRERLAPVFRLKPFSLERVDESASEGSDTCCGRACREAGSEMWHGHGFSNTGQFRKSVDVLKKCAGDDFCLRVRPETRILHNLWSRKLRVVEFVSIELITGIVLEAGSSQVRSVKRPCARQCESQEVGPQGGDGFHESGARLLEGPRECQHASLVG